ncbi:MAG: hypothetical protein ACLRZH_04645 [Ruthenibacterium lactatiformans]
MAIATGMTAFIKESLDTQDPESALPIITVRMGMGACSGQGGAPSGLGMEFFLTQEKRRCSRRRTCRCSLWT